MGNKTCTKCGRNKNAVEFHKHVGSKDGLQSNCKSCQRPKRNLPPGDVCIHCAQRIEKGRGGLKWECSACLYNKKMTCGLCKKEQSIKYFDWRNSNYKVGRQDYCASCEIEIKERLRCMQESVRAVRNKLLAEQPGDKDEIEALYKKSIENLTKIPTIMKMIQEGRKDIVVPLAQLSPDGLRKECSKCDDLKPIKEFYRNLNYFDGLEPMCKLCKHEVAHE